MPSEACVRVGVTGGPEAARIADTLAKAAKCGFDVLWHERGPLAPFLAACDIVVTLFDSERSAEEALLGHVGMLQTARRGLRVLDLTPTSSAFMVALAARCAAQDVRVYGGALGGGCSYADEELARDSQAVEIVRWLGMPVRVTGATGTSKAMAIVEGLIARVNAAVAEEALVLGARAGVSAATLVPLLLKGSGGNEALRRGPGVRSPTERESERDLQLAQQLGHSLGRSLFFGSLPRAAPRKEAGAS